MSQRFFFFCCGELFLIPLGSSLFTYFNQMFYKRPFTVKTKFKCFLLVVHTCVLMLKRREELKPSCCSSLIRLFFVIVRTIFFVCVNCSHVSLLLVVTPFQFTRSTHHFLFRSYMRFLPSSSSKL